MTLWVSGFSGQLPPVTGDALPVHDTAHDPFMTLPPYHSAREDEVRHLSSSPQSCRVGLCVRKGPLQGIVQRRTHPLLQGTPAARERAPQGCANRRTVDASRQEGTHENRKEERTDDASTRRHDTTSCTAGSHPCGGGSQPVPGLCPVLFFRPRRLQAAWGGS